MALRMVTRTAGPNRAVKDGRVRADGVEVAFEEVPVLVQAFRRMVRGLEWDACEMALTTYLVAREHGVRFTALPIFLVRDFHHGAVLVNRGAGVSTPKDLEGRRVGVNRGYTVTTGVWARAILAEEHGVDLGNVTWVLSGDEHVAAYVPPPNVVPQEEGRVMEDDLASGALPVAVNLSVDSPQVTTLLENPLAAGLRAFEERGHWPINHLIVVRDDVLAARPEVARALFDAFAAAKRIYLDELRAGMGDTAQDRLMRTMMERMGDPLPYGIEPNRAVLENLIGHATAQGILKEPVEIDALFADGARGLQG